ncbi:hypothetical protein JST97_06565 [bacterium]|nr:hypothetical protein [bacterium]
MSGQPASQQSDLYALAATFYEWIGLNPLFSEQGVGNVFVAVLQKQPKDLTAYFHPVQGRVPIDLARIIASGLHKAKEKRPTTVKEFADRLRNWLNGEIQPACPCTTIKFGFRQAAKSMDDFPFLAMPLVLLWLLYPLISLIQWLLDRFYWSA